MNLATRWKRFWNGSSYSPRNEVHVTRLRASAPVVTEEEMQRLERKWRQQPIDFDKELPIG